MDLISILAENINNNHGLEITLTNKYNAPYNLQYFYDCSIKEFIFFLNNTPISFELFICYLTIFSLIYSDNEHPNLPCYQDCKLSITQIPNDEKLQTGKYQVQSKQILREIKRLTSRIFTSEVRDVLATTTSIETMVTLLSNMLNSSFLGNLIVHYNFNGFRKSTINLKTSIEKEKIDTNIIVLLNNLPFLGKSLKLYVRYKNQDWFTITFGFTDAENLYAKINGRTLIDKEALCALIVLNHYYCYSYEHTITPVFIEPEDELTKRKITNRTCYLRALIKENIPMDIELLGLIRESYQENSIFHYNPELLFIKGAKYTNLEGNIIYVDSMKEANTSLSRLAKELVLNLPDTDDKPTKKAIKSDIPAKKMQRKLIYFPQKKKEE